MKVKSQSRARLLATPWTAAYQAPPSMGFSRQEYWSGVPLPSLRNYVVIESFLSVQVNMAALQYVSILQRDPVSFTQLAVISKTKRDSLLFSLHHIVRDILSIYLCKLSH